MRRVAEVFAVGEVIPLLLQYARPSGPRTAVRCSPMDGAASEKTRSSGGEHSYKCLVSQPSRLRHCSNRFR
ncbi:hypothetical protein DZF91_37020 [Actinomadura logoneensis]|uniref:Uncharacterized protein n=1 Tax=Actinomadura logoneensis TaxID=2293572 RepID=A0A372J9I8_9ACTN|nr:hypothetical protein DZF91_37020 [Actinomadura logoneensis]